MTTRPLGTDRPYPARTEALPRAVEEITADRLTGLLQERHPGLVVQDLETVEVKNSHTTKLRLRLQLSEPLLPEQVCVKTNLSGLRTGLICEREARFYGLRLSGELELAGAVPDAYFADWDDDGRGNGLVVMEDLTTSPGAFGTSTDHLGVDGVAAGLESLARLHGARWGTVEDLDWLPPSMGDPNDTEQVSEYWNYIQWNLAEPAYEAVVPQWVYQTPELMHQALDELSAIELTLPGPRCLVHGDAHQGNSFLRSTGERIWVDWQIVRRGSPWRDVAYFLVGSLTVPERRANDRALVEHYRQRLLATGATGVVSADEAWRQVQLWPAYGTQAWLGNINQWGQTGGVEIVNRQFAASEDWDTVRLLTAGRLPRRTFRPGEGAYRLPTGLRHS